MISRIERMPADLEALWARLGREGGTVRRLAFVGPRGGEGVTSVAAGAAAGIARHLDADVALIGATPGSGGLARLFDLSPEPGLAEVLGGDVPLERALQRPEKRLFVLPAGRGLSPADVSGERMGSLTDRLLKTHRFVLIDVPPILLHPEAAPLVQGVDRTVLVTRSGKTRRGDAQRAAELVEAAGVPLLGAVLNRYRPALPSWLVRRGWG